MKDSKAKQILKEKSSLLSVDSEYLFGEKFESDLLKTLKTKKKCEEFLRHNTDSSTSSFQRRPFQRGPPPQYRGGGGRSMFLARREQGERNLFSNSFSQLSKLPGTKWLESTSNSTETFLQFHTTGSISRPLSIFQKQLGDFNPRQGYSVSCGRLRDSIFPRTFSVKRPSKTTYEFRTGQCSGPGSSRHAEKRGSSCSKTPPKSVPKPIVLSGQKGWGKTSSGQSETSKCFHTLPALQNGGLTLTEGPASGERFPVQIGPKRRIFLRPNGKEIQEIPSFSLGRKLVRVPLHVFWPRTRPFDIYKADEDSNLAFKTNKHKSNSLSRRFSINGSNDRVSGDGKRHHHLSFATPGLCNKSGKVPDDPDQANRIPRGTSGFREDDCITSTRQSGEINQQVSNSSGTAKNDSSRVDQTNRKNVLCHTSSGTSQTPTQVFTVATDKRVAIERVLQYKNNPEQKIITGNYMVEENLVMYNGKPLKVLPPDMIIQTDASMTGWGAHFQGANGPRKKDPNTSTFWK